ncbi:hypothetical protein [Limnoglobus roseus]|nr:hypothetical protein [Limnoglobus roseus]
MTWDKVERIRPFLQLQPYIAQCRYADTPEGDVLDGWRHHRPHRRLNLADRFAEFKHVTHIDRNRSWFLVDQELVVADVVINRTPRYRDRSRFPWKAIMRAYSGNCVFVGKPEEHQDFCREWGEIPYHVTPTYLDLARVIAGSMLFIGNQSSAAWIALGLNHPTWIEQRNNRNDDCHFARKHAWYDGNQMPPDLDKLPMLNHLAMGSNESWN